MKAAGGRGRTDERIFGALFRVAAWIIVHEGACLGCMAATEYKKEGVNALNVYALHVRFRVRSSILAAILDAIAAGEDKGSPPICERFIGDNSFGVVF